jgi:hypothetical protein
MGGCQSRFSGVGSVFEASSGALLIFAASANCSGVPVVTKIEAKLPISPRAIFGSVFKVMEPIHEHLD